MYLNFFIMLKDNSKKFRRILLFSGRATRLEFNVIILALVAIYAILCYIVMKTRILSGLSSDVVMFSFLVFVLVTLYIAFAAISRRNHDMDRKSFERGDFFGADFYFRKGTEGLNQYGSDPLQEYEPQNEYFKQLVEEVRKERANETE